MYCTTQDVKTALAPGVALPNATPDASSLPDWQIKDAIEAAEGVVNAHVLSRYQIIVADVEVPVTPPTDPATTHTINVAPSPIRAWTRDIAAWYLTLTFNKAKDIGENDPIRLRFNLTLALLRDVRDRKSILPLPPIDETENTASGAEIYNLYEGTLFGPEDFNLTSAPAGRTQHFIRSARWGGDA